MIKPKITEINLNESNAKLMSAGRLFFTLRQFICNIHQKYNYQDKSCGYLNTYSNVPKITHFSNLLSQRTVIIKNIIPKTIFNNNAIKWYKSLGKDMLEPINVPANQAAEILIDNPEKAFNQGRNFFLTINFILASSKEGLIGGKI